MSVRKVSPDTAYRVARTTLGRMACMHADQDFEGHDHGGECLLDDESYVADLQLRLLAAVATCDDDLILARLGDLTEAVTPAD